MTLNPRVALLLACLAFVSSSAVAQDDVFGNVGGLFDAAAVDAAAVDAPVGATEQDASENALVNQLLEHASRGDLPLADAIVSLARLDRWSDVDRLLARTAGMNIDDATLAEMFQRIGVATYLRVKQRSDLSGPAQAGIDKLRVAASKYIESAERLNQAIEQLGSSSRDEQLEATRVLLSGGNAAIAALVSAALSEPASAKRDDILRTLLALGGGGTDALQQLALYGTPQARVAALSSLSRISRRNHVLDLATALHAADSSDAERELAREELQRVGGLPTRESTIDALALDLRRKYDVAKRIENSGQIVTLWSVNETRDGVEFKPAQAMHATYRELYDAAARLHRIGDLSADLNAATIAVTMGYHLMVDPDWGDAEQLEPMRQRFGAQLQGESLSRVMAYALESDDHAALTGLIRLIDPETMTQADRDVLLSGGAGFPSPLVSASRSPEPRVRYEAALKLAALAGDRHYAGSSQVMRTLSEMASLDDAPTVILVETRSDVSVPIEKLLSDLGLKVEVVTSVDELQKLVSRGGDLRMVIAKSQLADLSPLEMIDSVRRMHRGRQLPIVVYGDEPPYLGDARWTAPTTWIEGSITMSSLNELFDLAQRSRRMPALTHIDRQQYRESAAAILSNPPSP